MIKQLSLALVGSLLCFGTAHATPVVDQEYPEFSPDLGAVDEIYQEFQADTGNVAGGGLYVDSIYGGPATLTVSLYNASDVSPTTHVATGPALATESITATTGWDDAFWNAVPVTPGADYFLNFESSSGAEIVFGDSLKQNLLLYMYGYDYSNYATIAFRTWTEPRALPAPGALLLLGAGLLGFAGVRGRKKA